MQEHIDHPRSPAQYTAPAMPASTPTGSSTLLTGDRILHETRLRLEASGPVDLDRVTQSIYRALLSPRPWHDVVEHMAVYMNSYAIIVIRPPDSGDLGFLVCWPGDPGIEHAYRAHWWKYDPFAQLPVGEPLTIDEHLGLERWMHSELHQHLLLYTYDIRHGLGVNLLSENGTTCRLRLYRSARSAPFCDADKQRLRKLLPHFQQALQIASRLEQNETGNQAYEEALDRLHIATIVLDENRRLLRCNQMAETILQQKDGLHMGPDGFEAIHGKEQRQLRDYFRQGLDCRTHALSISRPSGKRKFGLVLRSIPMRAESEGRRRPAWVVFVSDPDAQTHAQTNAPVEILNHLFDFTPAEARLALMLADGCSLDTAAEALGIRRNTARAHLRAIFAKADVTRQADLVRLLLNGVIRLCSSSMKDGQSMPTSRPPQ